MCLPSAAVNASCPRSCGYCPYPGNHPGSTCTSNSDCTIGYFGGTGTCFTRASGQENYIDQSSFCLTPDAFVSCGVASVQDVCVASTFVVPNNCTERCTKGENKIK